MTTIELRDDTLVTSMPAGSWFIGGQTSSDAAPTAYAREAIYNYMVSALASVASSGSASDLSTGTLPLGRLHAHLADIASIATPLRGDLLYYNGSDFVALNAGQAGYVLTTGGAGTDPAWVGAGGGDMVSTNNLSDVDDPRAAVENLLLSSNSTAEGASLIGIEDAGGYYSGGNVETALQELGVTVASLDQVVILKGSWDASAGTFPGAGVAQAGWSYIVTVGGTVDSVVFNADDRIVALTDNASTTTFAANWHLLDYTDKVSSVAGRTGAVTLAQADISGLTTADSPTFAGLNGIAAIDATTEGTIEEAIDTLANLASIQGVGFTFGSYAATVLNNTTELGFQQAVNLEPGVDVQAYSVNLDSWAAVNESAYYNSTEADSAISAAISSAIGSTVQAYDAGLTDIAALAVTDGNVIVGNGTNWVAESGDTARISLGLGSTNSPTFVAVTVGNTGLTVGSSVPFSDATGMLTLQNIDALDAITEATVEASIDTLPNLTSIQGVGFTMGAYAATILNTANEAAFKAAVNLEIGTDVQAWDADLAAIAALSTTDSNIIVGNGTTWVAESGATARTSLGVYSTAETDAAIAAAVTAEDLDIAGDTGTDAIDLDSEVLTFAGGTGVATVVTANTVTFNSVDSEIVHDNLSGFVSDEHVAHSGVTLTAGAGLTGGGTIAASRSFAVGAGTGITVNADDVAVNTAVIASLSDLAATTTGLGASLIGIEDSGGLITATTVEAALAENRAAIDAIEADYLVASDIANMLETTDIGVTVQAWDAQLDEWSTVDPSENGKSLVSAANYAAMRGLLDLEAGTDFYSISGADAQFAAIGGAFHDGFSDFVADEHVAHSGVTLTAGSGLTGGGTIAASRSFAVGAGTGITVNADDVAVNTSVIASLANLAATTTGLGASLIGIEDAGTLITATTVEGALAENRAAIDAIEADYLTSSAIGSTVQAWDANLDQIAALTPTDSNIIVGNGTAWVAESGATARTSLGLGTGDSPQFTGLTVTGNPLFGGDSGAQNIAIRSTDNQSAVIVDGPSGQIRSINGRTWTGSTGINRNLIFLANDTAETGSNAGSNGLWKCYDDAGASLGNAFEITRATRVVNFPVSPTVPTAAPGTNTTQIASTAFVQAYAATVEASIDTLPNLTSIQGVSFTMGAYAATILNTANEAAFKAAVNLEIGTDVQAWDADLASIAALSTTAAGRSALTIADAGQDRVLAWDDTAGTVSPIALADITTEASPATGDYFLLYGAEGDLRKVDYSSLPGAGGGIANLVEDATPQLGGNLDLNGNVITGLEIGTDVQAYDADLTAIAALAKTDSNIIVGNGTTWVAESGATARTSLGLGTGDSPQFTAVNLGHASANTLTAAAGRASVEGRDLSFVGMRNVTDPEYGADNTGVTDAEVAFEAADAAGGTIYVGPGTYAFAVEPTLTNASWLISPDAVFTGVGRPTFFRDFWTDIGNGASIWRLPDRVFVGGAASQDGSKTIPTLISNGATTWLTQTSYMGYFDTRSTFASYSRVGKIGGAFASRSSDDDLTSERGCIGVASFTLNDNNDAAEKKTTWNYYGHNVHMNTNCFYSTSIETDIINLSGTTTANSPYAVNPENTSGGYAMGAGGETAEYIKTNTTFTANGQSKTDSDVAPLSYGLAFISNTTVPFADRATYPGLYYNSRFAKGIIFGSNALKRVTDDETSAAIAIEMAQGHVVRWKYGDGANANQLSIRATGANASTQIIIDADASGLLLKGADAAFAEVPLFRLNAPSVGSGNSTNFLAYTPTQTGGGLVTLSASSSIDTNVSFNLVAKGSGVIQAGGVEVATISGTQTLTNKTLTAPRGVLYLLAASGAAQSVGATTAETVLATIAIGAGVLGPNGFIVVETGWTVTSNANAKTMITRFGASGAGTGGTAMKSVSGASLSSFHDGCTIQNTNSATAQVGGSSTGLSTNFGGGGAVTTAAINTTAATEIVITGTKGSSGDTLTLNFYRVFICYGA